MEYFNKILKKNPEYDPNLSWDKIIKSWEENFLGSNQHNYDFSNPLEADNSFDNSLIHGDPFFTMFFDQNLHPMNANRFTCINENCMKKMYNNKLNNKISSKNSWTIARHCDYISKPFFRLVLKKNLSEYDIKKLLYLLADCEFTIKIGGLYVFKLPKLLFAYLICEKLSNQIKLFDVKKFLETNTMEEIRKKIYKFSDKSCSINQKYYVSNADDLYIDIPLLVDFFSYNFSTALVALQYNEVKYNLLIPPNKLALISNYLEDIVLMFEELFYAHQNFRKQLVQNTFEFIKMKPQMEYFHCWKGNMMDLYDKWYSHTKFIFIVVRQHETTDIELNIINQTNCDVDISQLPQIIKVELEEVYNLENQKHVKKYSSVQLENIWVGQFDDLVIYGIAADGVSSMKNWIKVQSECIDSIEKMIFVPYDNTTNFNANNLNINNFNNVFSIVNLTGIKIYWSETSIQTNVEIFIINQNIQRVMSGMTGDAYSD